MRPKVHFSGGAYLWLYGPFQDGATADLQLWAAYLALDVDLGDFALHLEPRISPRKLRPFYPSNVWVQEAYIAYRDPYGQVKVGDVYSRMGREWDGSFYGNIPFFDGIALDPDLGISAEGKLGKGAGGHLAYAAQFFVVDAESNGALGGRDTIAIAGGRRRNQALVRLVPGWRFADGINLELGLTAERFIADLPDFKSQVWRTEADLTLDAAPVQLFGEVIHQNGRSLEAFPLSRKQAPPDGQSATRTDYVWGGAQVQVGRITLRYTLSWVDYRDTGVREWIHLGGFTLRLSPNVELYGEVAFWRRKTGGVSSWLDKSVNATLYAHF